MNIEEKMRIEIPNIRNHSKYKTFPFRLGTTSYVYPADILPNVTRLAGKVDDIQLILFEGEFSNLPSPEIISELKRLGELHDLTYTIHFPINFKLGDTDEDLRQKAVESHKYIIELTKEIAHLYVIHAEGFSTDDAVTPFIERIDRSFSELKPYFQKEIPVCVENLHYPLELLDPIIQKYDLSICLDNAHLMVNGYEAETYWKKYGQRCKIIHFQGSTESKEHLGLPQGDEANNRQWLAYMQDFTGTVCLEVFDTKLTLDSINYMLENF